MRATLKNLHIVLGLILAVPLALIGITGSVLAISEPAAPAPAAQHRPAGAHARIPRAGVDAIVRVASASVPDGFQATIYTAASAATPAQVTFTSARSPRGNLHVYVDPVTLAVTPMPPRTQSFYGIVHSVHETLLAGAVGRTIVGWIGIGLLVLAVSGPFVWWPGRRSLRAGFAVRRDAGGFRFARDLHRVAGVWAFAFLIVLSVTGIAIVFPAPVGRTVALLAPSRSIWSNDLPLAPHARDAQPMTTAAAIALAQRIAGAGRVRSITFARGRVPLRIDLVPPGSAPGNAIGVLIDPYARRVLDVRDPRTFSLGEHLIDAMRPLHEGHILGTPWRIVLVIVGLCPPFFAVTGITMWVLRRRRRATAPAAPALRNAV